MAMSEEAKHNLRVRQMNCKAIAILLKSKYPHINGSHVHQYFYNDVKELGRGNFLKEALDFFGNGVNTDEDERERDVFISSIEQLPGFKKFLGRKEVIIGEDDDDDYRPVKRTKQSVDLKIAFWYIDKLGGDNDYAVKVLNAAIEARKAL